MRELAKAEGLGSRQIPGTSGALLTPDGTIHSHTSMRVDKGVTPNRNPEPHPLAQRVLDQIEADADARREPVADSHGHCAEVALVSDRLYSLEQSWRDAGSPGDFAGYARERLQGGVVATHHVGDKIISGRPYSHGDPLPPCQSCSPFLDAFGISHVDGPPGGAAPPGDGGPPPPPETPGAVGPGHPIEPTRSYESPGGLLPPDAADQQRLEEAVPRDASGLPEPHPDPRTDGWLDRLNDGGPIEPGRANNCVDCALSFTATWYGDPTVSAATVDPTSGGEVGGPDRIQRVLEGSLDHVGPDAAALDRVADRLRQAGPGSSAVVVNSWSPGSGGGGHAWNMVNHDGTILYVDPQARSVSTAPPGWIQHVDGVWATVLDAGGSPHGPASTPDSAASPQTPPRTEPGLGDLALIREALDPSYAPPDAGATPSEPDSAPSAGWGAPEFPRTLPDDHPLLTPTDTINTPERQEFRRQLVGEVLGDARAPETGRPVLHLMGGGGASGKGTVLHLLVDSGQVPSDNIVHLDPDQLKERIPEYGRIVDAGDSRAAAVVHEESSALAKDILSEAMDRQVNIVYDVTLGDPGKALDLIRNARDEGYEVRLYGVTVDAETAVQRNLSRAAETGRYVPVDMQLAAHRGFSRGFADYADLADRVMLFDNNGPEPVPIAVKGWGHDLVVLDPDRYDAFERKGTLDVTAQTPADLYSTARVEPRQTPPS